MGKLILLKFETGEGWRARDSENAGERALSAREFEYVGKRALGSCESENVVLDFLVFFGFDHQQLILVWPFRFTFWYGFGHFILSASRGQSINFRRVWVQSCMEFQIYSHVFKPPPTSS